MSKIYQKTLPAGENAGFTLIELLVVVLIIGILAAVALPQYQKAVEKSRAAQALAVLKSFGQAYQAYYMANGDYPSTFDQLDVDMKGWTGKEKWYAYNNTDTRSNGDWSLQLLNITGTAGIYIGRLTGEYKGAGFGFLGITNYEDNEILCLERTGGGVIFEKNAGDYCTKLFHASYTGAYGGTRAYTMP